MYFDTHCHLPLVQEKTGDLTPVIHHAIEKGVDTIVDVSIGLSQFTERLSLCTHINDTSPITTYLTAGIPPYFCDKRTENEMEQPRKQLLHKKYIVAIGEIGLDYYYNYGTPLLQAELFTAQIALANEYMLPIIIHTRDADEDLINILKAHPSHHHGIIHCFSSSKETAWKLLNLGFYLSFAGNITYKQSHHIHEVARTVPADRYCIETDAPYLSPHPHRGKPNEPAYITETASYIASLRTISSETVAQQTAQNARAIFQLTHP